MPRAARARRAVARRPVRRPRPVARNPFTPYRRRLAAPSQAGVIGTLNSFVRNNPMPLTCIRECNYFETILLTGGAVGVFGTTTASYLISSIFQPRVGTHQPYGRDTMALMYQYYRVLSFTMIIDVYSGSVASVVVGVQIHNSSDSTSMTSAVPTRIGEQSGAVLIDAPTVGESPTKRRYKFTITPAQADGLPRLSNDVDTARYLSLMTSNPSAVPTIELGAGDKNSNSTVTALVDVQITYKVEFSGRVFQAVS